MNLRYESHENRGFFVCSAKPSTVFSFNPKFKIVSIIPGIEIAAPERTETNNGFLVEFHFLPVFFSIFTIFFITAGMTSFGSFLLLA